jgi:general L-amino acid transport system ATP-binding protein
MTMIVVTHEMHFARKVAKTMAFMDAGKIVHHLPTDQFFTDPPSERVRLFLQTVQSQ